MKIQFEEQQIRIRINENEYGELKSNGDFNYTFDYLGFNVQLKLSTVNQAGHFDQQSLLISLTKDEIASLSAPEMQKNGLCSLVNLSGSQQSLVVGIQLDLHSKNK